MGQTALDLPFVRLIGGDNRRARVEDVRAGLYRAGARPSRSAVGLGLRSTCQAIPSPTSADGAKKSVGSARSGHPEGSFMQMCGDDLPVVFDLGNQRPVPGQELVQAGLLLLAPEGSPGLYLRVDPA